MTRGTASGRRPPREWFPALAVALTISVPVSADVLVKQETVSERMGGSGNSTVNRTLRVSADRSRSEERGTAAGVTGGGKPIHHVSISRLDKEVTWSVDADQQYTETTFAEFQARAAQAGGRDAQDMTFGNAAGKPGGLPVKNRNEAASKQAEKSAKESAAGAKPAVAPGVPTAGAGQCSR